MEWLAAIPVIGKAIDFVRWAIEGIIKGTQMAYKAITLQKLRNKKKEIQDAQSPDDWTHIINK